MIAYSITIAGADEEQDLSLEEGKFWVKKVLVVVIIFICAKNRKLSARRFRSCQICPFGTFCRLISSAYKSSSLLHINYTWRLEREWERGHGKKVGGEGEKGRFSFDTQKLSSISPHSRERARVISTVGWEGGGGGMIEMEWSGAFSKLTRNLII